MKMKCLVTGHSGLIGSHLVDILIEEGHEVYGISGTSRNENDKCKNFYIDLKDADKSKEIITTIAPDIVFALAADASESKSLFSPIKVINDNVDVLLKTLVPSINTGQLKRVVFASSAAVYGSIKGPCKESDIPEPRDIYGVAKLANENFLKIMSKTHGFEFVILRPHNVFGPRQRMDDPYRNVVTIFMNHILKREPYTIYGDGGMRRCFSYAADVAQIFAECGFAKVAGMTINVGTDKNYSLNELSDTIQDVAEVSLPPKYPHPRPEEVHSLTLDHTLQKKYFKYLDTPFKKALEETWKWAKKQGSKEYIFTKLEIQSNLVPENWK